MAHFHRARRMLAGEQLESKRLLAGDVSVATVGGNLFVDGDAAGNQIEIRSLEEPGRFVLRGLPGPDGDVTTINGDEDALFVDGINGQVLANLGAGNDRFIVASARFANGVLVNAGSGDDVVNVGAVASDPNPTSEAGGAEAVPSVVVGGPLIIRTGPGSDLVVEDQTVIHGVQIVQMGAGDDTLRMGRVVDFADDGPAVVIRGTLAVELGVGDDNLVSDGLAARHVAINGSLGGDQIGVHDARIEHSLVIDASGGEDHVAISDSHSRLAHLQGGPGPDQVASVDSVFGNLAIHLGQGSDTALALRTTVHGTALFSGGVGSDRLQGGMNSFNRVLAVGFEPPDADVDDDAEINEARTTDLFAV